MESRHNLRGENTWDNDDKDHDGGGGGDDDDIIEYLCINILRVCGLHRWLHLILTMTHGTAFPVL